MFLCAVKIQITIPRQPKGKKINTSSTHCLYRFIAIPSEMNRETARAKMFRGTILFNKIKTIIQKKKKIGNRLQFLPATL